MDKATVFIERTPFVIRKAPLIVLACLLTFASNTFAEKGPKIIAGPYLQHVTKTSMAIMWETDKPCTSVVKCGKATQIRKKRKKELPIPPMPQEVSSKKVVTIHELVLENLEAQTDYFYQVSSSDAANQEVKSEVLPFQTAVKDDSAFAYVVMGSYRIHPKGFKTMAKKAYAERPNFVLNVGGLVTDGTEKKQWISEYLAPASELMKRIPTYAAIENQEKNASLFYQYSSYPAPKNYYSFDYGNAHFTIIDSNADFSKNSKQLAWIKKDLASSKAKWKFVAHHHQPLSSGKTKPLASIYEKYGVDVVWCGSAQNYERTKPIRNGKIDQANGVIYIQSGGAAKVKSSVPVKSLFAAKAFSDGHYCLVTIYDGTFRMMVYDINGKMNDFLELKK